MKKSIQLLLILLLPITPLAAADKIDAEIVSVGVWKNDVKTGKSSYLLSKNYGPFWVPLLNTDYIPTCKWSFPQPLGQPTTVVAPDKLTFRIEFFLDNKSVETVQWDLAKGENFGKQVITAASKKIQLNPGEHVVSCKLSFQYAGTAQPEDPDATNNVKTTKLLVTNDRLDPLFAEEVPSLTVVAEPGSARLVQDIEIYLTPEGSGRAVRDFYTFQAYAAASKHTERVSYTIFRVAPGQEVPVGEIRHEITGSWSGQLPRGVLDYNWLTAHGATPGKYRVRASLSQGQVGGSVTGPAHPTVAEFTLVDPFLKSGPPVSSGPAPVTNKPSLLPDVAFKPEVNIANNLTTWDAKPYEIQAGPSLFEIVDPGRVSGTDTRINDDGTKPRCVTNIDFAITNLGATSSGPLDWSASVNDKYEGALRNFSKAAGTSLVPGEQRVITADLLLRPGPNNIVLSVRTQESLTDQDVLNNRVSRTVWLDGDCRTHEELLAPLASNEMPPALWVLKEGPGPHVLGPGLTLSFQGSFHNWGSIRSASNIGTYSAFSKFEERFHFEFTRTDTLKGGLKVPPQKVAEITGIITNFRLVNGAANTIRIDEVLTAERLARYGIGVGKYTVRAWVSQRTDAGLVHGPVPNPIEFTIWDDALALTKNNARSAAPAKTDMDAGSLQRADPVRTASVPGQRAPAPVPAGSATTLTGAAATFPEMTTMSGSTAVQSGADAAPVRTAAPALRAMNVRNGNAAAATNSCRMDVTYYIPRPPVIETSSPSLQAGDQVQVQCEFERRTRQLEWPQCDDEAKSAMAALKINQESGSRYSGMMIIDDANIGIATSPVDGASFDNTGTWIFYETGSHDVTCQVDNGLHIFGSDSPLYLQAGASVQVGAQSGAHEFRRFEPRTAAPVSTRPLPSQAIPPLPFLVPRNEDAPTIPQRPPNRNERSFRNPG